MPKNFLFSWTDLIAHWMQLLYDNISTKEGSIISGV
jgi:hypothetical protein